MSLYPILCQSSWEVVISAMEHICMCVHAGLGLLWGGETNIYIVILDIVSVSRGRTFVLTENFQPPADGGGRTEAKTSKTFLALVTGGDLVCEDNWGLSQRSWKFH